MDKIGKVGVVTSHTNKKQITVYLEICSSKNFQIQHKKLSCKCVRSDKNCAGLMKWGWHPHTKTKQISNSKTYKIYKQLLYHYKTSEKSGQAGRNGHCTKRAKNVVDIEMRIFLTEPFRSRNSKIHEYQNSNTFTNFKAVAKNYHRRAFLMLLNNLNPSKEPIYKALMQKNSSSAIIISNLLCIIYSCQEKYEASFLFIHKKSDYQGNRKYSQKKVL